MSRGVILPFLVGCQKLTCWCDAKDFSNVFGFFVFGLDDLSGIIGHGLQRTKESMVD
jgi:hypothetical protein